MRLPEFATEVLFPPIERYGSQESVFLKRWYATCHTAGETMTLLAEKFPCRETNNHETVRG